MSYLDDVNDKDAGKFGTKTLLRVPWGPGSSIREGGIGSTGGITLSREAIRELRKSEEEEAVIELPTTEEDGAGRGGGIGSTGSITISRDAIRDISAGMPAASVKPPPAKSAPATPATLAPTPSATVPTAVPSSDPPPVTLGLAEPVLGDVGPAREVFAFLQSRRFPYEREGFIFGDVFANEIVRNGGWSELSEKVNGRVAQVAFLLALAATGSGDGDVLVQIADHPLQALVLSGVVTLASLPPIMDANTSDRRPIAVFKALVPSELRQLLLDAFEQSPLRSIFTEEAELTNGRAAMLAMGVFIATAALF